MGVRAKPHKILMMMVKTLFLGEKLMLLINRTIIQLSSCRVWSCPVGTLSSAGQAHSWDDVSNVQIPSDSAQTASHVLCAAIIPIWLSSRGCREQEQPRNSRVRHTPCSPSLNTPAARGGLSKHGMLLLRWALMAGGLQQQMASKDQPQCLLVETIYSFL